MRTPIIISICCLIIAITATAQTEATNSIHEKGLKGIIVGTYPSEIGRLYQSVFGCELCNQKRYV